MTDIAGGPMIVSGRRSSGRGASPPGALDVRSAFDGRTGLLTGVSATWGMVGVTLEVRHPARARPTEPLRAGSRCSGTGRRRHAPPLPLLGRPIPPRAAQGHVRSSFGGAEADFTVLVTLSRGAPPLSDSPARRRRISDRRAQANHLHGVPRRGRPFLCLLYW